MPITLQHTLGTLSATSAILEPELTTLTPKEPMNFQPYTVPVGVFMRARVDFLTRKFRYWLAEKLGAYPQRYVSMLMYSGHKLIHETNDVVLSPQAYTAMNRMKFAIGQMDPALGVHNGYLPKTSPREE